MYGGPIRGQRVGHELPAIQTHPRFPPRTTTCSAPPAPDGVMTSGVARERLSQRSGPQRSTLFDGDDWREQTGARAMAITRAACVCVECAKPVPSVVHADRLTQCDSCGSFADKYVEYEPALIVLDMLLHRPSVYRHLLHNSTRLVSRGALLQLGCTLCLFDTYLKWLRLGGNTDEACHLPTALSSVVPALLLSLAEQLIFCAVIRAAILAMELPAQPWDALVAAVLLSSFGKCFAVLHVIWSYPDAFVLGIEGFVLTCNCVALAVQLRCETSQALGLVAVGGAAKAALSLGVILSFAIRIGPSAATSAT